MLSRARMWTLAARVTMGWIAPGSSAVAGGPQRTRSCGIINRGYPIQARATPNVSCTQARRILPLVINGSTQCYSGPARFHPCHLEGFYCTMHSGRFENSTARCVKGRKLIIGRT
jgi:hypothetical protein